MSIAYWIAIVQTFIVSETIKNKTDQIATLQQDYQALQWELDEHRKEQHFYEQDAEEDILADHLPF